ncbi:MAG TPA: ABC transporter permease [Bryobacteraceae bacterium]|jgi:putative ABC transport system permease protein|nr:ABC transporter permease [Bryobacteraceae bacterium]
MGFVADIHYALRTLRANPSFTIPAIVLLALGIGANTAVFSVVEGVLLRPLPYRDPSRLCMIWKAVPAKNLDWDWTGYPAVWDWREQNHVFADIAAVARPEASVVTLMGGSQPERIQAAEVEGNLFSVLGAAPLLGRTFSKQESQLGDRVAILSYSFWQQHFGGSRDVLGRRLPLDRQSCTIIGVMSPSFEFPNKDTQLWLLISADPRWKKFQQYRFADAFTAIGRLKSGVSLACAKAGMNAIAKLLATEYPATDEGLGVRVIPLADWFAGPQVRRTLWVLLGAVFCVLLITCSNVANLLFARGVARSREFALRAALGAGRGRLIRQVLTETIVISSAAGFLGIVVSAIALKVLLALAPADLPRLGEIRIDTVVLAFALLLSLLTGLVFGLFPALHSAKRDPNEALKDGSRGASARTLVRLPLVAAQCALAFVLLTGAGLLVRSFLALQSLKPGFNPHNLLTFTIDLPNDLHGSKAQLIAGQIIAALDHLPGVQSAALGGTFENHIPNDVITVEGQTPEDTQPLTGWDVSPKYFQTIGLPLQQGRVFTNHETSGAVISEFMARRFWPRQSPLGKRFKISLPGFDEGDWYMVLGVVGDRLVNGSGSILPTMYKLAAGNSTMTTVVRTNGNPLSMVAAVRQAVREVSPAIPRFEITTVDRQMLELQAPRRFETTLLTTFAAIAMLLAAAGIYGFLHHAVAQREKEIGIRLALGAQNTDVVRLVLSQALRGVFIGLLAGLLVSFAATRVLASALYGVTATDPITFAGVAVLFILVAIAASSLPARQASQVDPIAALRQE